MPLSNDLVSKFIKVINDGKKSSNESTVFGTTVIYNGSPYVRFDGSDLLTPVVTTTDTKEDERVTVLVKNHTAIVTGNLSSPSARTEDVKELGNQISDFEIVIADKVSTEQLDAANGRIDNLVSDNASIKDTLSANSALIAELKADNVEIKGNLTASDAEIENLKTTKLDVDVAYAKFATIENLDATNADIYNLRATYGEFVELTTKNFEAKDAEIEDLQTGKLSAADADLAYAKISQLEAVSAKVDTLDADVADIDTLIFGSATGNTIQTSFANAVIAQLGNAQIKSAMIDSVSADNITAGDIITNNVRVMSEDGSLIISDETIQISDDNRVRVQIGKDSSNDYSINIWDADGNLMFSEGGITDSAIKEAIIRNDMVSDDANISASKLDISSLFKEINDSSETIKSTKIYLDDEGQTLDVAFTEMTTEVNDLGTTVSSQGTAISTIQGQISSKIWQEDIDEATGELSTQYSNLEQTVNNVSSTVASHTTDLKTVNDKVTSVEQSLDSFEVTVGKTYATKGELTDVTEQVNASIEAKANEISLSVDEKISNIEIGEVDIGCRNLLRKSDAKHWIDEWITWDNSTASLLEDGWVEVVRADGRATCGVYPPLISTISETGDYMLSFDAYSSAESDINYIYIMTSDGVNVPLQKLVSIGTEPKRYEIPLVISSVYENCSIMIASQNSAESFYIRDIMLEKGTVASDWTPAPEDTDESIDSVRSELSETTHELRTEIISTSSQVIMSALESYVTTDDYDTFRQSVEAQLSIMSDEILMNFNTNAEEISNVNGDLQAKFTQLYKYIKFTGDTAITIGSGDSSITLEIDNESGIVFKKNGVQFGWWDGTDFHTGNIVVELNERAQFGNFAFVPRSDGSLMFLKVGG